MLWPAEMRTLTNDLLALAEAALVGAPAPDNAADWLRMTTPLAGAGRRWARIWAFLRRSAP